LRISRLTLDLRLPACGFKTRHGKIPTWCAAAIFRSAALAERSRRPHLVHPVAALPRQPYGPPGSVA